MKTIVKRFEIKSMLTLLAALMPALNSASASDISLSGLWKTSQHGNFEEIQVCINDSSVSYSRGGENEHAENYSTMVENIIQVEDVVLISFYHKKSLLRKFVVVHRNDRHELVGQLHLYDGFRTFNYIPVYLEKIGDACSEDG